ncbi:MAG TPA: carbohydrate-binding module family 20 domain-containing protein [Cellvibrio sp.]|nr:carbohydrate-binding module family 20 domain-containing protein [Cellvibrio sp.]
MKKPILAFFVFMLLASISLSTQAVPRTVFVHLFEWQWDDIASECENYLGPYGFSAVQVSPPQKSISGSQWWTRYQPVSYAIEGRSGSRAQFISMVSRCKATGVDIYVDAIINHMAAGNRNYPEVPYLPKDFHSCTNDIDYSDMWQVQNCDLFGLNDLKTESEYVREKTAAYLTDLLSMGVAGFRIDAAKHMPPADIANILSRLNGQFYVFQEVIGGPPSEPVKTSQFNGIGPVTEFNFSYTLGHYFKGRGALKELRNIGQWNGWLSSADAVVFVANHDNQRQKTNEVITHKDGANLNNLAHIFMLGWPYGYPQVMSSFDWSDINQGPPSTAASQCNNGWLCEHRARAIRNMVAFSNNTAAARTVSQFWDNGNNQLAWSRGGLGYVAINREDSGILQRSFQTGLPAAVYCDIIHADFNYLDGSCSGATIAVDANGAATFAVASHDAVAFHIGARVGVPCPECGGGSTSSQSSSSAPIDPGSGIWYFRGTPNNWSATPLVLQDGLFCTEQQFSGGETNPRFKIDHYGDWTESYPASDYSVSANTRYKICFNAASRTINLTVIAASSSSASGNGDKWYFRGTPNNWGASEMVLQNGLYCSDQQFGPANENPRFKIDHYGNWVESYPGNDFTVAANNRYRICFNAATHVIAVTPLAASSSSSSSTNASTSSSSSKVKVRFVCNNGTTYLGQSVYVTGNSKELGNWNLERAVKLNPVAYPRWEGSLKLSANTNIQWKCVKREELNPSEGIVWQGGSNITVNTGNGITTMTGF